MVQRLGKGLRDKILVGLTGTFGSGKSTVGKIFEKYGCCVIDADRIAHEALRPASPVYSGIAANFPEAVAKKAGPLDRKRLARVIFASPARKKKLEALIHPYVYERMLEEAAQASRAVVVLEVPLLFETGFHGYCHHTVTVNASDAAVAARIKARGFATADIKKRNRAQMSASEKEALADFAIDNSGTLRKTEARVKAILKQIQHPSKGV